MKIIIRRSARRKRTVGARVKDGVMEIVAPANISEKKLNEIIQGFRHNFEKREKEKLLNRGDQLQRKAQELNSKYFEGRLEFKSIKYSARQLRKFGTCCPARKTIIINGCLKKMPQWVEDYVIIHELAHIIHPNHSAAFWESVKRYPKAERAIGYLIAKGVEEV